MNLSGMQFVTPGLGGTTPLTSIIIILDPASPIHLAILVAVFGKVAFLAFISPTYSAILAFIIVIVAAVDPVLPAWLAILSHIFVNMAVSEAVLPVCLAHLNQAISLIGR